MPCSSNSLIIQIEDLLPELPGYSVMKIGVGKDNYKEHFSVFLTVTTQTQFSPRTEVWSVWLWTLPQTLASKLNVWLLGLPVPCRGPTRKLGLAVIGPE